MLLKVLQVNQSDISGGAAIAGYRLHQGLLSQGIDSKLLVSKAELNDVLISTIDRKPRLENRIHSITNLLGLRYIHFLGSFDIPKHPFFKDADVINFHNLHSGAFNYFALPLLTRHKPSVFTLHDMWSFTGHCAYSYDCDRWKSGCGKCPYPNSYPSITRDNTRLELILKKWVYNHSQLVIVTLSEWLTKQAKQSILKRFHIQHIPNGIDTDKYRPLNSRKSKLELGLPNSKKVIMFAAHRLTNYTKGADLLIKALQSLPITLKSEIILLTIGKCSSDFSKDIGIESMNLGYVTDEKIKAIAYSSADIFVFPTRADNLPLVLQESMACGTPMISFNIGGVPDLVRHGITGYLAEPENFQNFSKYIVKLLEDDNQRRFMSSKCREIALAEYSSHLQTTRYISLYNQLLKGSIIQP